jgi:hypothetical protein
LANIVTKDLARDLIGDVVSLIGHSKPYVRKKSVLSLYKLYTKYPQGLRLTFEKLKEVGSYNLLKDSGFLSLTHGFMATKISLVRPETRGRGERGRVVRGERDLRAGQQEPQELSGHGAQVLPPAHHLVQQLDAHQGKPKSTE